MATTQNSLNYNGDPRKVMKTTADHCNQQKNNEKKLCVLRKTQRLIMQKISQSG